MNSNNLKPFKAFLILMLLLIADFTQSQVLISDAMPFSEPNSEALLELRSANHNKGLLMPKVALSATNSVVPLTAHVAGMTVYNTQRAGTAPNNVTPGFYYNDGTKWMKISTNKPFVGDIKQSVLAADHNGWYLLNGRALTTLPTSAKAYAEGLGFSTVLPDASNKFLKMKQGSEVLGTTGGSDNFTLSRANLPNVTFSGTALADGAHTHNYYDRANGSGGGAIAVSTTVADNGVVGATTSSSGAHTHTFTVSSGGSDTPVTFKPTYLVANMFVYLGN